MELALDIDESHAPWTIQVNILFNIGSCHPGTLWLLAPGILSLGERGSTIIQACKAQVG
jgi:hypothetical protein